MKQIADRYNEDKNRIGLVPHELIEEVGKVMTKGALKYAPNNWRKGLPWMSVIDSLERHLNAFKSGIDYDNETGLKNLSHAATNIAFLLNFYKSHPEMDDRPHSYLREKRIALDIDDVICNFLEGWCKYWNQEMPNCWYFDSDMQRKLQIMREEETLDSFYLELTPKINPKDIPFEPICYITARSVDTHETTLKWLKMHGFPQVPLYTVGNGNSKVDILKQENIDIFVDDSFKNFVECNKSGICTYLFDACHNQHYEIGYKRIKSLKELI